MTALHGVWITSIVGAILFWVAGYLLARSRGSRAEKTAKELGQQSIQQTAQLEALEQERARLEQEVTVQGGRLDAVQDDRDRLEQQTLDQHNRISAIEEERDEYREEVTGFTARIISTEGDRDQFKGEVVQLNEVLTASMQERDRLSEEVVYLQAKAQAADNERNKVKGQLAEMSSERPTREVREVTQTGANVRAALLQSEEKRRSMHEALLQSQSYQTNLSLRLKKHETSLAEAHQEIGALQLELSRSKEEFQAVRSELTLKSNRLTKLEQEQKSEGAMGELETTPGGTGMPLTKKTLSLLLERTRSLQIELNAAKERENKLGGKGKRQLKLEQLLSVMKSRLENTENQVGALQQERDRLMSSRLRTLTQKPTLPGGFDGP